jgi:16S rRNA (guanine966-N2)-methyltransferase
MTGLRITGGSARGRVIPSPRSAQVRPTSSRVREALFSVVGQRLEGARVLDAFGGTGLLGFEAWSRGAGVVICERDPRTAAVIRTTAADLGADVEVLTGDVLRLVSGLGQVDGVLADPPYDALRPEWVSELAVVAAGWLVVEARSTTDLPAFAAGMSRDRVRTFGETSLHVYRR